MEKQQPKHTQEAPTRRSAMTRWSSDAGKAARAEHVAETGRKEAVRGGWCGGFGGRNHQGWVALLKAHLTLDFVGENDVGWQSGRDAGAEASEDGTTKVGDVGRRRRTTEQTAEMTERQCHRHRRRRHKNLALDTNLNYLVSQKYTGDRAQVKVLRNSQILEFNIKLSTHKRLVPAHIKGRPPSYYIIAGFVFTAVSVPYLRSEHVPLVPILLGLPSCLICTTSSSSHSLLDMLDRLNNPINFYVCPFIFWNSNVVPGENTLVSISWDGGDLSKSKRS
ncbi:hypothetical protein V8G54_020852 [Vigna mungo]|uniref:Protease Do-like PDZ domain-containing protein n=1 Tax=Vigna mungo TaxID=3915 RepID=A0AAQ3NEE5_VIGMU